MALLLVEDDDVLRDGLTRTLQQSGFVVEGTAFGGEALDLLRHTNYEMLILDLGLPDLFGLEVLQRLRAEGKQLPVLILTALDAPSDRVNGLNAGADDYLCKPFDLAELEARIRALLRRFPGNAQTVALGAGPLRFDSETRLVYLNDKLLDLSSRESCLLESLLRGAGQVVSKEQLVKQLSDVDQMLGVNAIEVYMHRLRKKLEPWAVNIRTVRGLGYLLETGDDAT